MKNYLQSLCVRIAHLDLNIENYNQLFGNEIIFILQIFIGTFRTMHLVNVTTVSGLGSVFCRCCLCLKISKSRTITVSHTVKDDDLWQT